MIYIYIYTLTCIYIYINIYICRVIYYVNINNVQITFIDILSEASYQLIIHCELDRR